MYLLLDTLPHPPVIKISIIIVDGFHLWPTLTTTFMSFRTHIHLMAESGFVYHSFAGFELEFVNSDDKNIKVNDGSTLELNFTFIYAQNESKDARNHKVSIERQTQTSDRQSSSNFQQTPPRICQLVLKNQSCSAGKGEKCSCSMVSLDVYQLMVPVNRENDGVWIWSSDSSAMKNVSITVEATCE